MTAQEYILRKLKELAPSDDIKVEREREKLVDEIVKRVLSKKYRKYTVSSEERVKIIADVALHVEKSEPILIKYVFGGYKLWRLPSAPEVDFAELFSLIYFVNWLKPVCEIYEPGVDFEFVLDDVVVPILNNITEADLDRYRESLRKLIDFVSGYIPKNLKIGFMRIRDLYETHEEFLKDFEERKKEIAESLTGGLPKLTPEQAATIKMNVRPAKGQTNDLLWREKVQLNHDAYMHISKRRPYYRGDGVFDALASRPPMGRLIVGTTRNGIMKFWIGTGALERKNNGFEPRILSVAQLESASFETEMVNIKRLSGKNFKEIRILK
jgi:hypothetical protein